MRSFNFSKLLLSCLSLIIFNLTQAQYISVDKSLSAQDLVTKFIGSQNTSCITVTNVSVSGQDFGGTDLSYGYFNKNGSSFSMEEGIVLSTGKVSLAPGPNNNLQSEFVSGWNGDQDLFDALSSAGLPTDNLLNATYLEFDFESLQSDKISFEYMFLSEEYRRNNCRYSDAFAFLIKKADNSEPYSNIALVPGTNIPVTSLSINGADDCPENIDYFGGFNENPTQSPTNFNGQTKVLKAVATVQKGVKYHIKLVIADHGDTRGLYDSAVFLKSGSFTGNINIGTDLTIGNGDPLCKDTSYTIAPNPPLNDPSAKYLWFKNGQPILDASGVPVMQDHYDVINEEGDFSVDITLGSGCRLKGSIYIEKAPVAQISTTPILLCDNDFDGSYSAKLSSFDNQIIRDFDPSLFTRSYALSPTGTSIDPDSEFAFSASPQTLYLRVAAYSCAPEVYPIQFYFGTKLSFNTVQEIAICDNDINGNQNFNLSDYISLITNETGVAATYFDTEAKAKAGGNSTISNSQTISADLSVFIRLEKAGYCPGYKEIVFRFKQPRESLLLKNMQTVICKGSKIDLIAETNFDYYKWSNGVEGPLANKIEDVEAKEYYVELTSNGCVYKQFLTITEAEEPVIDDVLINGSTVTVLASGGTPPYTYALDNGSYQNSNIFSNVQLGTHTVFVKGSDGCAVTAKDFSLISTQNVITPNNDGVNDFIDYSSLLTKLEPRFEVYDRDGILLFKGDTNNQFIWNGSNNGRELPTSTYWYILEWNESVNQARTKLAGWILLKNRN